jgi:non-heme chloroperoxidase
MNTVKTKDGIDIFYKDWGKGPAIVFSHGWPLSADDWDAQMMFFLNHGFRVIAHDRRGHGRSTGSFWPRSACQSTRSTKRDQR